MKDRTIGSYTELVEVGRKYQGDSKIMFDKMQDFAQVSAGLLAQVEDSNKAVEAISHAAHSYADELIAKIQDKIQPVE